jgi:hypothetical protein
LSDFVSAYEELRSCGYQQLPEITHDDLFLDVRNEAIMHKISTGDLPILQVLYKGYVGHCFNHFSFICFNFMTVHLMISVQGFGGKARRKETTWKTKA